MSNALAIAGVTEVLREQLEAALHDASELIGPNVHVTALPPDQVKIDGQEVTQLNLFMYRVSPNTGWTNAGLPTRDTGGSNAPRHPPLALDLHYLLSAFSNTGLEAEALLGLAMQVLHETPVLTRAAIKRTLAHASASDGTGGPVYAALAGCALDQQAEQIRVTPEYLGTEELTKLWTAMQARFHVSMGYAVSVLLIDSNKPATSPLPVLTRGGVDPVTKRESGILPQPGLGPRIPQIDAIVLPNGPAVQLGDVLAISGESLQGSQHRLLLRNDRLGVQQSLAAVFDPATGQVTATLPAAQAQHYPAGLYALQLEFLWSREGTPVTVRTNAVPLAIAPQVLSSPASATRDGQGGLTISITCAPWLQPGQRVSLILGTHEAPAHDFTAATDTAQFTFGSLPPSPGGSPFRVRLRVDDIDSAIVDRNQTPPVFIGPTIAVT